MPPTRCRHLLAATGILLAAGCSDPLAEGEGDPADKPKGEQSSSVFIVSEAQVPEVLAGSAGGLAGEVAYISAMPGSLPQFVSAGIRNPATGEPPVTTMVVAGGFDPVAIVASAGDQLELTLTHAGGTAQMAYARVPGKRPPVVVRTFPAKGRTDVALGVIPTVIFSEPIDGRTLAGGARLFRGGEEVPVQVELLPGLSWQARVLPVSPLEPATTYELRITPAVRDLDGDSLEVPVHVAFTTDTAGAPPPSAPDLAGKIIVSEAILDPRSGETLVYVSAESGALPGAYAVGVANLRINEWFSASTPGPQTDMAGFEPAVVPARAGDSLLIRILFEPDHEPVHVYSTVPESRNPVLLRIRPADGHVQVPLETFPTLVFSEPIDSSTLASAVRLVAGSNDVPVRLQVLPQAPWKVQVVPVEAPTLAPATVYQLHVLPSIEDRHGDRLEAARSATFTTAAALPAPGFPIPDHITDSRIAFSSDRSGFNEIFVAQGDGSDVRRLADGYLPRWAPGGDRLVFMRDNWEIRVIEADGAAERFVTHGFDPNWSADGTRILYSDFSDLYSIRADGSGAALLLTGKSLESRDGWWWQLRRPASSPAGTIAFVWHAWNGIDWTPQMVWLVEADGSNPRPLSGEREFADAPAWSPDGTRIAFTAVDRDNPVLTIKSVKADGTDPRVHFTASDYIAYMSDLDWSADGRYIAFSGARDNPYGGSYRIYIVDVETGAVGQLVPGVTDVGFPGYSDTDFSWARVTP